jgi:hypothetical protein
VELGGDKMLGNEVKRGRIYERVEGGGGGGGVGLRAGGNQRCNESLHTIVAELGFHGKLSDYQTIHTEPGQM